MFGGLAREGRGRERDRDLVGCISYYRVYTIHTFEF